MAKETKGGTWFFALMTIPFYVMTYLILDSIDPNHKWERVNFLIYFLALNFLIKFIVAVLYLISEDI